MDRRKKLKSRAKKESEPEVNSKLGFISRDMAMDLGTANTLIYVKGKGIVINEPSVIAYNKVSREILAVGNEAKKYLGKTPQDIDAIRPLKDGVIDDFYLTQAMIREFFWKVQKMSAVFKPKAVISVPAGITQVEKRAIVSAAEEAGIGKIYLIEEPMAAAIGAGLNIEDEKGQLVIDIGGGTSEVAIISKSAIYSSESVRVAGDEMNDAIIHYLYRKHQLQIGENTAEQCKINCGSAWIIPEMADVYKITGKNLSTNTPVEIELTTSEIREALDDPVLAVHEVVQRLLGNTPPEMLRQIKHDGIVMAGGGSLLNGMDSFIENNTDIPCRLTEDPLTTIVEGCGIVLEDIKKYGKVFIN